MRSEHLYERGFFWATFLVLVLFCMEQGKIGFDKSLQNPPQFSNS